MKILELALELEHDGENYYKEQAEKNKNNSLYEVFTRLSNEEKKHAEILEKNRDKLSYELKESNIVQESKKIFKELEDFEIENKDKPTQLDFYRMALQKEEESIELYEKLLSESEDKKAINLYNWLIGQEENHKKILKDLVEMLFHAEEWVEHAEFGLREEY